MAVQSRDRAAGTLAKPALLIVALYYPPDTQSGAARPYRLAKYLERLGHTVHVCAAAKILQPSVAGNVHRLRGFGAPVPRQDLGQFIDRVFRQTLFVHDPGGVWAWRVRDYAAQWMNSGQKPVVLTTAPPATTHWAGYLMKRRYGVRWIADFRDPMQGNPFRSGRIAEFCDSLLEPLFFRHADALIANTDAVYEQWKARYPQWTEKMHVLWNGFDPEEELGPLPIPARQHSMLAHVGVIYGARDPHLVLRSFARLVADGRVDPAAHRICFTGARLAEFQEPEMVERLIARGCLELQEAVPRAEAQQIMATSDRLLLLDVISGQGGLQVPAKLFEYVRIGRPILASTTEGSPVDRILKQSGVEYTGLYSSLTDEEIDRRLLEFLSVSTESRRPSRWFEEQFDARCQAESLSKWL